jgi:hypothetical protein
MQQSPKAGSSSLGQRLLSVHAAVTSVFEQTTETAKRTDFAGMQAAIVCYVCFTSLVAPAEGQLTDARHNALIKKSGCARLVFNMECLQEPGIRWFCLRELARTDLCINLSHCELGAFLHKLLTCTWSLLLPDGACTALSAVSDP